MEYFTNEDYLQSAKQRKKYLIIYICILVAYLILSVGILIFYANLPYKSNLNLWVRVAEYTLTFIMVVFSFIYLGIPYKRTNSFYKMCKKMKIGLREQAEGVLIEIDDTLKSKDGVDMKSMIFLTYNELKKGYFERKVLVFYEKPFPEIDLEDKVLFVTQGNVLISYEIKEKAEKGDNDESDSNGDR